MPSSPRPTQDLDVPARPSQSPEVSGAAMRKHSPRTTRKDRSHPLALKGEAPVSQCIYALVQRNQQAALAAAPHRFLSHRAPEELPMRHDTVLTRGHLADRARYVPILHPPQLRIPSRTASSFSSEGTKN